MRGFLSDPVTVLVRLHRGQIATLIEILRSGNLRQASFVESVFNERARHFSETLQFLKEIQWVAENGDELELIARTELLPGHGASEFQTIADAIADTPGPYQMILAGYLSSYQTDAGRILHCPSAQTRSEQSAIRNFIMELGLVSHYPAEDCYELHAHAAHLYFWARNIQGATSKTELEFKANQREELGTSAEMAALLFERDQVGPNWAAQVEHVSAKNPGACFDIKSLRVCESRPVRRFIEVKAVPADSFQFYWTAAEIEAASVLRQAYYLYLIPAIGGRELDMQRMAMIEDPYRTVYKNSDDWMKNDQVIECRRKPTATNSQ